MSDRCAILAFFAYKNASFRAIWADLFFLKSQHKKPKKATQNCMALKVEIWCLEQARERIEAFITELVERLLQLTTLSLSLFLLRDSTVDLAKERDFSLIGLYSSDHRNGEMLVERVANRSDLDHGSLFCLKLKSRVFVALIMLICFYWCLIKHFEARHNLGWFHLQESTLLA